jgi:hypothetical protein
MGVQGCSSATLHKRIYSMMSTTSRVSGHFSSHQDLLRILRNFRQLKRVEMVSLGVTGPCPGCRRHPVWGQGHASPRQGSVACSSETLPLRTANQIGHTLGSPSREFYLEAVAKVPRPRRPPQPRRGSGWGAAYISSLPEKGSRTQSDKARSRLPLAWKACILKRQS